VPQAGRAKGIGANPAAALTVARSISPREDGRKRRVKMGLDLSNDFLRGCLTALDKLDFRHNFTSK
jgi:hypothetical protein